MYNETSISYSIVSSSSESIPQSSSNSQDHQSQMDQLKAQYEEKYALLQEQYGTEHDNRTKLEQDMIELKSEYEKQITEAKVKPHYR